MTLKLSARLRTSSFGSAREGSGLLSEAIARAWAARSTNGFTKRPAATTMLAPTKRLSRSVKVKTEKKSSRAGANSSASVTTAATDQCVTSMG